MYTLTTVFLPTHHHLRDGVTAMMECNTRAIDIGKYGFYSMHDLLDCVTLRFWQGVRMLE